MSSLSYLKIPSDKSGGQGTVAQFRLRAGEVSPLYVLDILSTIKA
jgi:hypothetical protein